MCTRELLRRNPLALDNATNSAMRAGEGGLERRGCAISDVVHMRKAGERAGRGTRGADEP